MPYQAQLLNTGSANDDHTGDTERAGGTKLNQNMAVMPWMANTVNAGFFAVNANTGASLGQTAVQTIQAAINYAVANGFGAVYVPNKAMDGTSLLPYDASAVTFNAGVHMTREGGGHSLEEWDVDAYGGANTDAYPGCQAACDAAQPYGTIIFGSHNYTPSQPIWAGSNGNTVVHVRGQGVDKTTITPSFYGGGPPLLLFHGDGSTGYVPTGTALLTGAGNSWSLTTNAQTQSVWLDFRDSATLDGLNGASAFCIECTFSPTDVTRPQDSILFATGTDGTATTYSAFYIQAVGATVGAGANINGTMRNIASAGTIANGGTYHVALTYDGTTLRLFLAGSLIGSAAFAGTLTLGAVEQITIGTPPASYDAGFTIQKGLLGKIDGVGFWSVTHYPTTGFTPPTAKPSLAAGALLILNFDLQRGPLTRAVTNSGDVWLMLRLPNANAAVRQSSVTDMTFAANGSQHGLAMVGQQAEPARLRFNGCRTSLYLGNNAFFSHVHDITFLGGGITRQHIALVGTSGVTQFDNINIGGGIQPVVVNGSSFVMQNCYLIPDSRTQTLAQLSGGPFEFYGTVFSNEGIASSAYKLVLSLSGTGHFHGCSFTTVNAAFFARARTDPGFAPACTFIGCNFDNTNGPATVFQHVNNAGTPWLVENCTQTAWVPWSNQAGVVRVGPLGKGAATAFSTPLTLDCSKRDDFELAALTGAITINFSNVTPGQKISLWTVQNAGGGNAITFGTVNGTGSVKGATANDTTGNHYSQYLFDANLNGNMTQIGFSSGA